MDYGDPSRPERLRAAGAGQRALVLAVDDVEAPVRAAATVRHHFPRLPVYARARNRHHAHRLMEFGARVIVRETFDSSHDEQALIQSTREAAAKLEALFALDESVRRRGATARRPEDQARARARARHAVGADGVAAVSRGG